MMVKNVVFIFTLLLAGCGVMNNPTPDKGVIEGALANDAGSFLEVVKISGDSLVGDANIEELNSYKIFETKTQTEQFLSDLNNTSGDIPIVEGWIKNIQDANINYQTNNFLFYPILENSNCGREDNVTINDTNVTITVLPTMEDCNSAFTYHLLLYQVDKSIENILISAFERGTIIVKNSAN